MFSLFVVVGLALFAFATVSGTSTTIASLPSTGTSWFNLAVDATASFGYVLAEYGSLYKVDLSSGQQTTLYAASGISGRCYGIGLDNTNSELFIGDWGQLHKYAGINTGSTYTSLTMTYPFYPQGMVVDTAGTTMFISDTDAVGDSSAGAIWKVTLPFPLTSASSVTRLQLTLGGTTYTPGAPKGLAFVGTNLYFVESFANKFSKVAVSTGVVTNIITSNIARPMSVAVDALEAYGYVSTWTTPLNAIIKVDLATNTFVILDTIAGTNGLSMDPSGSDLYAISTSLRRLVKVSTTAPSPTPSPSAIPTPSPTPSPNVDQNSKGENNNSNLGLIALIAIVPCGCVFFFFFFRQRKSREIEQYKQTVPSSDLVESAENAEKDESQKDFVGTL